MHTVYLLSVYFHIVAAIIWLGGAGFIALVMVPVIRDGDFGPVASMLFQRAGLRFRLVGWICLGVLLVTGTFNLYHRGLLPQLLDASFYGTRYGVLVAHKLGLMAILLLLSAFHDFRLGPRAGKLMQTAPHSPEAQRLRRTASWLGRGNAVLGLLLVLTGVILVRGC